MAMVIVMEWVMGGVAVGWFAPHLSFVIMNVDPETDRGSFQVFRVITTFSCAALGFLLWLNRG